MSKTLFSICLIVYAASALRLGNAQSLRQPTFTIVNGNDMRPAAAGAAASVTLPVLGFLLDSTHEIRPVIGVPGSASIGASLTLGFEVLDAVIPPGHDYILAITSESDWPLLLHVRGGTITIQPRNSFANQSVASEQPCDAANAPLPRRNQRSRCQLQPSDLSARIDRIALSPTGSAAAFFSESQRRVYVFTNLSQSPALLGTFNIGGSGALSAFAISDDGTTVAFALSEENTGSFFLHRVNEGTETNRFIASVQHASVIKFLYHSDSAIIADSVNNKVYALSNGQFFTMATAEQGISGPLGIAVSNDNQRIFVANSASGSVTTIGPYGIVAESRHCDCALTGLHPTNADSVFRLTDFSGGPVLLFDGSLAVPRIIFLPVTSLY